MDNFNWKDFLGWGQEQLEDLRFTGYSYIRQGKYDVALPFFEALVIVNPENAYDVQTLGALYLQLDEVPKALKHLNKALEYNPAHIPTLLNQAKALLILGYKEKGLRLAKKLRRNTEANISDMANALIMAYS